MKLTEISEILDRRFNVSSVPVDLPFSSLLPRKYDAQGIEFRKYFTNGFLEKFHGLMLDNCQDVKKVYLVVFLSDEVLNKIFDSGDEDVLIFTHHPMLMETTNRGFLPLAEKYFTEMKERRISVYVLHSPLDINEEISTSRSIAKRLSMVNEQACAPWQRGFSGVYGELPKSMAFSEFIKEVNTIFGIKESHFIQKKDRVFKVGVIAGGGTNLDDIRELIRLGCDTYLTGDYVNKVQNEFGYAEKSKFDVAESTLDINLIECSHYATEKVVLTDMMADFFKNLGLDVRLIEQLNPWE